MILPLEFNLSTIDKKKKHIDYITNLILEGSNSQMVESEENAKTIRQIVKNIAVSCFFLSEKNLSILAEGFKNDCYYFLNFKDLIFNYNFHFYTTSEYDNKIIVNYLYERIFESPQTDFLSLQGEKYVKSFLKSEILEETEDSEFYFNNYLAVLAGVFCLYLLITPRSNKNTNYDPAKTGFTDLDISINNNMVKLFFNHPTINALGIKFSTVSKILQRSNYKLYFKETFEEKNMKEFLYDAVYKYNLRFILNDHYTQ